MTGVAVDVPPIANPTPSSRSSRVPGRASREGAWLRRPLVACLLLLASYATISVTLNDQRASLGADSGGKLATLRVMSQRDTLDPDIGYWAERYDESGSLHAFVYTRRVDDRFVQVTTLPMLELALPLYELGGIQAALLLPMLGGVLSALAARALARRLGGGSGWPTFWAIGLATPVAIYALDFWEHSVGLALTLWAVVFLFDVVERRAGWRGAGVAGFLFGAAATLRTEALVYLVAATGVACLVILVRQRAFLRAVGSGLAVLVGAAVPLVLNSLLERAIVGADLRSARAGGIAAGAGSSASGRVQEAFTSTIGLGLGNLRPSADWTFGAIVVVLVGSAAWVLRSEGRRRTAIGVTMAVLALTLYLTRFASGLGFVPGLLVASPLAAAGILLGWRDSRTRVLCSIACVALPMAWLSQYTGSMWPQWGGRYVLLSGALLAIGACVALRTSPRAMLALCLVAGCVTAGGVIWLGVRTHTNAQGIETILARHDEVLIARHAQFFREVGAFYDPDRHWLTAATDDQLDKAVRIARESGARELAMIGPEGQATPRSIGGYTRGPRQLVPFTRPDVRVQVTTYRLIGSFRAHPGAFRSR